MDKLTLKPTSTPIYLRLVFMIASAMCLISLMLLISKPFPTTAQPIFATVTPRPPDPLDARPELPQDRYALRLWTTSYIVEVLVSLLNRRNVPQDELFTAVKLMQYEMKHRFPNIPQDILTRQRLLETMRVAPRGTSDMRWVARPLALAQLQGVIADTFAIERIATLNIDGDAFADTLYRVRIPADIALPAVYEDYILVRGTADGLGSLPTMPADIYAAPYGEVLAVDLLGTGDFTGNGLDEVLIRLDLAGANDRLAVYGWRNGAVIDLALPTAPIYFGETVNLATGTLHVLRYEVNSSRWGCYTSKGVRWVWSNNFFRPVEDTLPAYLQLHTIGCQIVAEEPLYAKSPTEMKMALERILIGRTSDESGYAQAILALAVLEWLEGKKADASLRVIGLSNTPNLPSPIRRQIATFQQAVQFNLTPLQLCAALTVNNGVCDIDQLIGRILAENPITRAGDVRAQLTALGLPIQSLNTVSQIGRADRIVVVFDLVGASVWAFAPLDERVYTVEKLPTDISRDNVMDAITIPQVALDALLINNDGVAALSLLENMLRLPMSLEVRYFRALCFDLIGNRQQALNEYYQLWQSFPDTLWGRLAGAHLEVR